MSDLLSAATRPSGLTEVEASDALAAILAGRLSTETGAALLVLMRRRGETAVELSAVVRGLLAQAVPLDLGRPVMDVVGTGGSGRARYNASTTACFVLAAAGVPVAKHGNRGSKAANGSFDLLEALGVPLSPAPGGHRRLLDDTGICFIFARQVHPAIAAAAAMRKLAAESVTGTIFNLAGPLANPARPVRLLLGSSQPEQAAMLATAVQLLGTTRAVVACGHPGIDEVSVTGATSLWLVEPGRISESVLPAALPVALEPAVTGGNAPENAVTFQRILTGEERGPLLDYVVANAGTALATWRHLPPDDAACRSEARHLIASGSALTVFRRHRAAARALAGLPD